MTLSTKNDETCKDKLLVMLARDAYRFGDFKLSSGGHSNHYVNCKPVTLSGEGLALLSIALLDHVEPRASSVAGLTLGADPLVSGVCMAAAQNHRALDALIVRKEAKGHGTGDWLEGPLPKSGSLVTVLEDVTTTGASSLRAVERLRDAGFLVNKVVSIVDRLEGAKMAIQSAGLELVSLYELSEISDLARSLK